MLASKLPPVLSPNWRDQASHFFQTDLIEHIDVVLTLPAKFFFSASILTGEVGQDFRRIEQLLRSMIALDFSDPKDPTVDLVEDLKEAGFSLPSPIKAEGGNLLRQEVSVLEVAARVGCAFLLHLINRNKSASKQKDSEQDLARKKRDQRNKKLAEVLREAGFTRDAEKVQQCSRQFRGFITTRCGCSRAVPVCCGNRLCAHCQGTRAKRIRKSVEQLFARMKTPKLLTLTIPNSERLDAASIDQLRKAFTRFRHRASYKKRCRGGFYVFEITHRGKGWNLHIHFLADCSYWPQEELSREWQAAGGGQIVDIRQADAGSVQYIAKYLGKGLDLLDHPGRFVELYEAIKGKRLYGAVGDLHGVYSEIKKESEVTEPFDCQHGNPFEYAGKLSFEEVYLDPVKLIWRAKPPAYLRLLSEFSDWVTRSPNALVPV